MVASIAFNSSIYFKVILKWGKLRVQFLCSVYIYAVFSKPFVVYARRGSGNYMTSRLDTLLGKFGFQDRWKHLVSSEKYLDCDYSNVPALIEKEQQKMMEYLSDILNSSERKK